MPQRDNCLKRKRQIVATYDYRDDTGKLIYRLHRYVPKGFAFVKPNGHPWTAVRRRPLLYRLPELIESDQADLVFVVEGEKDVDRLWSIGLVATCNAGGGGRGKWLLAHSRNLRERSVIIIPDNDKTGREHAQDVAQRIRHQAAEVRIVHLPGLEIKGDVSDWLEAGGSREGLLRLCATAPAWKYSPARPSASREHNDMYSAAIIREQILVSNLGIQEKLLLIILSDCIDRASPSQEMLATYLGVTERRVRQLIAALKRNGVLRINRMGRQNHYGLDTGQLASSIDQLHGAAASRPAESV